jgi:hypothetical protein
VGWMILSRSEGGDDKDDNYSSSWARWLSTVDEN